MQGNVVSIVPQTIGTVVGIDADDGMKVVAGQALVHLDPNDARVAYDQSVANLANTVRQVRGLYSAVDAGAADLAARQASVERARADLKRREGLVGNGAVSAEELAHARNELAVLEAGAALDRAATCRATARWSTRPPSASQPQVEAAASQLRQAYLNLQRTAIVAPVSGYVAKRQVQLGQRVQPGTTLMTIVPLEQVWVEANFKETQLSRMRIGQPVKVHSDLYGSDVEYDGKVASLGMGTGSAFSLLPAQNASGNWIKIVQRVPVRIEVDPTPARRASAAPGPEHAASTSPCATSTARSLADARKGDKTLFTTAAYDKQLTDADALIGKVIKQNLPTAARH